MKVPYRNKAYVPENKLINYILSPTHNVGKHKARIFRSLGFTQTNSEALKQILLDIVQNNEFKQKKVTTGGVNYVVEGEIRGSGGRIGAFDTVWIVENNKRKPRFVTVKPV